MLTAHLYLIAMPRAGSGWPSLDFRRRSRRGATGVPADAGGAPEPSPAVTADAGDAERGPPAPAETSAPPFSSTPPLVLLTTVDVGGGRVESITVTDGDDLAAAAASFCAERGLPASVRAALAAHLASNLGAARAGRGGGSVARPLVPPAARARLPSPPRWPRAAAAAPPPAAAPADSDALAREADAVADAVDAAEEEAPAAPPAATPPFTPARLLATPPSTGLLTAAQHRELAAGGHGPVEVSPRANPGRARGAGSPPHPLPFSSAAPPAGDRLHSHARALADKLDAKRAEVAAEADAEREAGRARPTWVSAQLAAARGAGPFDDYAHRLYAEGIIARQAKERRAREGAAAAAAAELDGATWTPSISRAARALPRGSAPVWTRLATPARHKPATAARLEALKADADAAAAAECTFAPAVSAASRRLMRARADVQARHKVSTHDALYHDAERRRQRLDEAATAAATAVGRRAAGSRAASVAGSTPVSPSAVADRLAARAARDKAKRDEAAAAAAAAPTDDTTGRPLFAPAVGRPPAYARNEAKLPVGDYLYRKGQDAAARKEAAEAAAAAAAAAAATARATPKSADLMDRLRARRFRAIHKYLASGGAPASGRGSSGASPREGGGGRAAAPSQDPPPLDLAAAVADDGLIASMDPEVAADVRAAAAAAAAARATAPLTVAAFAALMDAAVRGSGPRSYLQPSSRHSRAGGDGCTFAPAILPESAALAAAAGRRPAGGDPVAAMEADARSTAARLEAARAAADEAALAECTFAPTFVAKRRGAVAAASTRGPAAPASPGVAKYERLEYELRAVLDGVEVVGVGALALSPPASPPSARYSAAESVHALRELAERRAAARAGR